VEEGRETFFFKDGTQISITEHKEDLQVLFSIFFHKVYGEIEKGQTIMDIGGNFGSFTLFAAQQPDTRIFTFEPSPVNFELLEKNVKSNSFPGNVTLVKKAVSSGRGTVKMATNRGGYSTIVSHHQENDSRDNDIFEEVETITLTDAFNENGIEFCDLMKIDCEGSEYDILYSASKDIFSKIGEIRMECDEIDNDRRNPEAMIKFLEEKGFKVVPSDKGIINAKSSNTRKK